VESLAARISVEKKNEHSTFIADLNDPIVDNCHMEFVTAED
jgi:hypothetical protein